MLPGETRIQGPMALLRGSQMRDGRGVDQDAERSDDVEDDG